MSDEQDQAEKERRPVRVPTGRRTVSGRFEGEVEAEDLEAATHWDERIWRQG
ncbi:hypothetical protein ACGRHY_18935 [Streptomyces sp. HK10]|uniref:hypothetical protein n=1 Tax=Streptomyces sp. HK10 TaxID=3373255 RepID=UPI003747FC92